MSRQSPQLKKLNGKKAHRLALNCLRMFGFLFAISICIVGTFGVSTLCVHCLIVLWLLSAVYGHGPSRIVAPMSEKHGKPWHSRKVAWCSGPPGTGMATHSSASLYPH